MARRRDRALWLIVALSLLVHLLLMVAVWPLVQQALKGQPVEARSLDLRFSEPSPPEEVTEESPQPQPEPEPEPQVQEPDTPEEVLHLPRDTGEETDLDGTDFEAPSEEDPLSGEEASGEARAGAGSGDTPEPQTEPEPAAEPESEPQADERPPMPDPVLQAPESDPSVPEPRKDSAVTEEETTGQESGMDLLEEPTEADQRGEELVSELEKRRIEMANRYLRQMQQQILRFWQRPSGADERHRGEIRFSVDSRGRLTEVRISRPSGHPLLDISALEAVRSVSDYAVPDRPDIVRRYYQDMIFRYSGAPLNQGPPE
ncbi:MAG: TonB family protein [Oleiphilaceae bacterium]|nr:TonB family protein [Oleiphilaceae bacterium]